MAKQIELSMEKAIELLESQIEYMASPFFREAINMAIKEMRKAIPKKPVDNGNWSPKTCPSCNHSLSVHQGDGYYTDSDCLEACPNCRQLLDWN